MPEEIPIGPNRCEFCGAEYGAHLSDCLDRFNDLSLMLFGKHRDEPLQDVPASYFHWLWTEADYNIKVSDPLHHYIKKNLHALKNEYPDGIWS